MNIDNRLYNQAKKIIEENQNCSISFLQRALCIGYNRASELITLIKKPSTTEEKRSIKALSKKIAVINIGSTSKHIISSINKQKLRDIEYVHIAEKLKDYNNIRQSLEGVGIVFLVSALGGETGSSITPMISKILKEMKILVVSIVTMPFNFEGQKRFKLAEDSLIEIKKYTNSIFVINNDNFLSIIDKTLGLKEIFKIIDSTVSNMITNILEPLLSRSHSIIDLDYASLHEVLSLKGVATIGIGESKGNDAAYSAIEEAIKFPFFDNLNTTDAIYIFILLKTHPNYSVKRFENVMNIFDKNEEASVIFTTSTDSSLAIDSVQATVIVTGFNKMLNLAVNKDV